MEETIGLPHFSVWGLSTLPCLGVVLLIAFGRGTEGQRGSPGPGPLCYCPGRPGLLFDPFGRLGGSFSSCRETRFLIGGLFHFTAILIAVVLIVLLRGNRVFRMLQLGVFGGSATGILFPPFSLQCTTGQLRKHRWSSC